MAAWAYLDDEAPIAFAHRGGAGDWPENSMPAFAAAVELGYRYLETDVHVTRDGVLVAFHDDRLDRVTDRSGVISELSWAEVKQARIAGSEPIPLLTDLLEAFPEQRFNIDTKHDACVEPLVATLASAQALGRVCIGSFSDRRLRQVRSLGGPGLCTSAGPRDVLRLRLGGRGAGSLAAACVQVPPMFRRMRLVDERFVATCHQRGLPVHVWTIDDADEMRRLLDLGVDGIMTDRPAVLKAVLADRGQWPS